VKPGPQTINAAGQITEPDLGGFIAIDFATFRVLGLTSWQNEYSQFVQDNRSIW